MKLTAVGWQSGHRHSPSLHVFFHIQMWLCCASVWLHTLDFPLFHFIYPVLKIFFEVDYYFHYHRNKRLNHPQVKIPQCLFSGANLLLLVQGLWVYRWWRLPLVFICACKVGEWTLSLHDWATPVFSGWGSILRKALICHHWIPSGKHQRQSVWDTKWSSGVVSNDKDAPLLLLLLLLSSESVAVLLCVCRSSLYFISTSWKHINTTTQCGSNVRGFHSSTCLIYRIVTWKSPENFAFAAQDNGYFLR